MPCNYDVRSNITTGALEGKSYESTWMLDR